MFFCASVPFPTDFKQSAKRPREEVWKDKSVTQSHRENPSFDCVYCTRFGSRQDEHTSETMFECVFFGMNCIGAYSSLGMPQQMSSALVTAQSVVLSSENSVSYK